MQNQVDLTSVIARIHTAIALSRTCHRHEIRLTANGCAHCMLESRFKRFHPVMKQVMRGVVAPSWERERL